MTKSIKTGKKDKKIHIVRDRQIVAWITVHPNGRLTVIQRDPSGEENKCRCTDARTENTG